MTTQNLRRLHAAVYLLAGMTLAGAAAAGTQALVERGADEGTTVILESMPRHQSVEALRGLLADARHTGVSSLDLVGLRRSIRQLPWVAEVQLRRAWPDRLVISIREHEPVAVLPEGRFLTRDGARVALPVAEVAEGLPVLNVVDAHAKSAFALFQQLSAELSDPMLTPAAVTRDARGSWTLTSQNGIAFRLGKGDPVQQMNRLQHDVVPAIRARIGDVAYVDMRYGNGFAVGWEATRHEGE